jgi:hypothetical protein
MAKRKSKQAQRDTVVDASLTEPAWQTFAATERAHAQLSPLARAALSCGVAFDDVYEYCLSLTRRPLGGV